MKQSRFVYEFLFFIQTKNSYLLVLHSIENIFNIEHGNFEDKNSTELISRYQFMLNLKFETK